MIFLMPARGSRGRLFYNSSFALLSLREFRITDTELKLMAAAAIIGLSKIPKNG